MQYRVGYRVIEADDRYARIEFTHTEEVVGTVEMERFAVAAADDKFDIFLTNLEVGTSRPFDEAVGVVLGAVHDMCRARRITPVALAPEVMRVWRSLTNDPYLKGCLAPALDAETWSHVRREL